MNIIISIVIILIIIAVPIAISHDIKRNKWLKIHCIIIGKMADSNGFGVGANGHPVITYEPGKTGYKCDDGYQYWE